MNARRGYPCRTLTLITEGFPDDRPIPLNQPVRPARLAHLTAEAGVFSAAVLLAPFPVASAWPGGGYRDVTALRVAVSCGFVRFWSAGGEDLGADLARAEDFWARFHIVTAALAGVLFLVLAVLLTRVWREFALPIRPCGPRASTPGCGGLAGDSCTGARLNLQRDVRASRARVNRWPTE